MERIYSLKQASTVTGFSLGKFRYNRALLEQAGVTVSGEGWRIPHSVLEGMGWLGVKEPKGELPPLTRTEVLESRVKELEAENAELRTLLEKQGRRRSFLGFRS